MSQRDSVLFCSNCCWPWLAPLLELSPLLPCPGQEGYRGQGRAAERPDFACTLSAFSCARRKTTQLPHRGRCLLV